MKEIFHLIAYRFHTKDDNKFLIIGCFSNNDSAGHEPVITLDGKVLTYFMEEISLKPLQFGMLNGTIITKRYYIWVDFPKEWEAYHQLTIVSRYEGIEEKVKEVPVSELKELAYNISHYVDSINEKEDGFRIEGWFIGGKQAKVVFTDMSGKELPVEIKEVNRPDVLTEYPEIKAQEVHGFQALHKGKVPKRVKVCYVAGNKQIEEVVKIRDGQIAKTLKNTFSIFGKVAAYYSQFGLEAVFVRAGDKLSGRKFTGYEEWLRRNQPFRSELRKQKRQRFSYMPKISIVIPIYKTPENYLDELIESIRNQTYTNWELCLSDGSGDNSPMTDILQKYQKKDKRIRVVHNNRQLHISENTNEALKITTGDYIAFADHDDLLTPDALYECVRVLNAELDTELIYSDEDKINMDGTEYFLPHLKSDYSLDLLRSNNYFCHLVVVKRELYEKVGMLNPMCDGAQDFDFVLRCVEQTSKIKHIPKILYHWRAHKDSTAGNPDSKPYVTEAGIRAVQGHYDRLGIRATVLPTQYIGVYRTKFELEENPLVSVIIPNKDHVDDLDKCIRSLEERNTYTNIEYIIVENNSQNKETFQYYKELEKHNPKVRVVYWDGKGFNYPAINNYGVKQARGDYLLFLNNDTEIINSDCIEEMLMYGMREDVGAVGAKMYYEDGTIQHAGVIVGLGGVAGHAFLGCPHDAPGFCLRAVVPQNLSAVTAACMLMRRKVFEEVGGFDERFSVAFNDVDLCLKIRKSGYLIVYNPYAELYHYESKSRGYDDTPEKRERFIGEINLFQDRWREFLASGDPYYNPNLTLDQNDFGLNMHARKGK